MKNVQMLKFGAVLFTVTLLLLTSINVVLASTSGNKTYQQNKIGEVYLEAYNFPALPIGYDYGPIHCEVFGLVRVCSAFILWWDPGVGWSLYGFVVTIGCQKDGDSHVFYTLGGASWPQDTGGPFHAIVSMPLWPPWDPFEWEGDWYPWDHAAHDFILKLFGDDVEFCILDFDVYVDGEYMGHYHHDYP